MKLSQKILIVLAGMFFFLVTVYRFKYDKIIEIVPLAAKKGKVSAQFVYDSLNYVSINGWMNVTIVQGDKNRVLIIGPGNLVNYFLAVGQKGDSLTVNQVIDFSKYADNVVVTVTTKNLSELKLSGGAACHVRDITGDNINLTSSDSSIVVFTDCFYKNSNLKVIDKSSASVSSVVNSNIDVCDKASLILNCKSGILTGKAEREASFYTKGEIKENKVQVAEIDSKKEGVKNEKH